MISAIDKRVDEYRREAAVARVRAAGDPHNRTEFLHVAENWEALAREVERLAENFRPRNETVRI